MATTNRQSNTWHHGSIAGSSWTTPSTYVYTGGTSPNFNMARQTFSSQTRIDNIGTITGLEIYTDTVNTAVNYGEMYVSNTALAPNRVKTDAKKIGDWRTPDGNPFWMSLTVFSPANLLAGIGSSTTWYCYWINTVTTSRSFYSPTVHPTWRITYSPGLIWVYDGSSWKQGQAYVYDGSTWKLGAVNVYNGSAWKLGI